MIAVLDASVLAKLFLVEPGSDLAEQVVDDNRLILAPGVARIEVASAITRAARNKHITVDEARKKLAEWKRFIELGNVRLAESDALQPAAEAIALNIAHPLMDCFYLALAVENDVPFITADEPLVTASSPHFTFIRYLFHVSN